VGADEGVSEAGEIGRESDGVPRAVCVGSEGFNFGGSIRRRVGVLSVVSETAVHWAEGMVC